MSVKVDLKLTRLHRVIALLAPNLIDRGAHDWAEAVKDRAQEIVPVDTGFLRSTIHVEHGDRQGEYRVVADAPYAAFVEYGTSRMAAQPYLTPASRHVRGLPFFANALREMIR